ncbi:MAG: DUF2460 domain-containing protein [Pseudogulbenkiania sp.]|nr:DUF2460 domain-containing protein [Pseudogulbenkiania sp.]
MSEFLEQRFPIAVRLGASYEDDFVVDVGRTKGGKEHRRLLHPFPIRRFTVSFSRSKTDLFNEVLALYHRTYGKYAGFRVRAFDDWSTNGATNTPTPLDQQLIKVSAGVYQLIKAYGLSGAALGSIGYPYRKLFKPVTGTVRVAVDGIEQMSGFTIDHTTGLVTFAADPGAAMVTGGCEFDIPCRFDSTITVSPVSPSWAETEEINLMELIDL